MVRQCAVSSGEVWGAPAGFGGTLGSWLCSWGYKRGYQPYKVATIGITWYHTLL